MMRIDHAGADCDRTKRQSLNFARDTTTGACQAPAEFEQPSTELPRMQPGTAHPIHGLQTSTTWSHQSRSAAATEVEAPILERCWAAARRLLFETRNSMNHELNPETA